MAAATAQTLPRPALLYKFCQGSSCFEPQGHLSGPVRDAAGNLFGAASDGGKYHRGMVYELERSGDSYRYRTLYDFCAKPHCVDGFMPSAKLTLASDGSLYGTTFSGGAKDQGVVFVLRRHGTK